MRAASRREFLWTAPCLPGAAGLRLQGNVSDAMRWLEDAQSKTGGDSRAADRVREQFPALSQSVEGRPLIYLDSAATTQRPAAVIGAMNDYYRQANANPSKSLHVLARRSAEMYQDARNTVAKFVNARQPEEIVFTRGTTEAINLVASSWGSAKLRAGDEVVLTIAEHYSNIVPWQLAVQRTGAQLRFVDVDDEGRLKLEELQKTLTERTKLLAFAHVSNVQGRIEPAREICRMAHRAGALALMDAAQSVPHVRVDVRELDCDFLAFSGHKMLGPMGIGVLWARREILEEMPPYQAGSNMAYEIAAEAAPAEFAQAGLKFEAGTPNVAGALGLAAAMRFLESLGREETWEHEQQLTRHTLERLREIPGLRLLGPKEPRERIALFAFAMEDGPRPEEIVRALDERGIAIRGGDLAAKQLLKRLGFSGAARASAYVYTSREEIDALADALTELRSKKAIGMAQGER